MSRTIWLLGALLCTCFAVQQDGSAHLNATAPAQVSDDAFRARAEIEKIQGALPGIIDRGAALFLLAKEYVRLGELPKALSSLKECLALDEGFDPSDSPALQPLRSYPEFQKITAAIQGRYPPVHHARIAFTVPEKDLFPEGLAVDPEKHIFYMGSMHRKKIVMINQTGETSDFVKPDLYGLLGLGGIKVDPSDHGLWAASDNDHDSELLHFDAQGRLLERFSPPGAAPHVLNDLALHGSQEIYVTDTLAHQVYRFDRKAHSFTPMAFPRPLFYPNGIALSDDGNLLYVADLLGVILVDLRGNSAHEVDPGSHNTLAGIDGLYWYKNGLLAVQYGTGSFRVMRWRLSSDGRRVASAQVLESRTPLVSFPTTGAVHAGSFYFIANTGIANLQDDKIVDPSKLEPVHIAVVALD